MLEILLSEDSVVLHDCYRTIKSTTTVKNVKGEVKQYVNYNCSFPYVFFKMFDFPDRVYVYEHLNRFFITDEEPPNYYLFKAVKLHCRKNAGQKSSSENVDKQWARLITIPKTVFGDVGVFKSFHYELHCGQRDFVTQRLGLLEVYLSKRDI